MHERFQLWSSLHLFILLFTFSFAIGFIYFARTNKNNKHSLVVGKFFASILILNYLAYVLYRITIGKWEIRYDLPMEFCNWSMIVTSIALFNQNKTLSELSYFWVMSGSIQGIITPDLQVGFPHIYFFIFFIAHSGLVISCLYLVFGLKIYPRKFSIIRTFIYTQIYLISAFIINYLLNGNYGYTMHKPFGKSFLDLLGEWPYYLFNMQFIGLVFFIILYLPFYFYNKNQVSRN